MSRFTLNFHYSCVMIAAAPTIAGPIVAGVVIEGGKPIRRGRFGLCRAGSFFTRGGPRSFIYRTSFALCPRPRWVANSSR